MASARPSIVPGSLADRIRTACPAGVGATLRDIQRVALARPEDVRDEVNRLRRAGYIRTYGHKRAMRYFWRATNRRKDAA
jgi:chromosome condensin MukBEF MukE localization factor